jgi:hypothetical protein
MAIREFPAMSGGQSNLFDDPKKLKADLRTVQRAIRLGWNIPPDLRELAMRLTAKRMAADEKLLATGGQPTSEDRRLSLRATELFAQMVIHSDTMALRTGEDVEPGAAIGVPLEEYLALHDPGETPKPAEPD